MRNTMETSFWRATTRSTSAGMRTSEWVEC